MRIDNNRKYIENSIQNIKHLIDIKCYEDAANYAKNLCRYAWLNFTGYYSIWKIEHYLNIVGNKIPKLESYNTPKNNKVLHICSEIYETGGHTKLVFNWIKNDPEKEHFIAITRPRKNEERVAEIYQFDFDKVKLLEGKTTCALAYQLKKYANEYQYIVLHIHPDDVIPLLAFSDVDFKIPIIYNNHADHIFWIGNSIIDILVQIRNSVGKLDVIRRNIKDYFLLPILPDYNEVNYKSSYYRKGENKINILSTGSQYKYKPTDNHDFFSSIYKIAQRHENVEINIAGVNPDYEFAQKCSHPNINFLGNIENLQDYEANCDIYVEGFPIASFTALLQPAIKGKCIQLMHNPPIQIKLFEDDETTGFVYPTTEENWQKNLSQLIVNKEYREQLTQKQQLFIKKEYSLQSWKSKLENIYEYASQISHTIKKNKNDIYFQTQEEILLNESNSYKIYHFDFLNKLSFKDKITVVSNFKSQYNVHETRLLDILKFLVANF